MPFIKGFIPWNKGKEGVQSCSKETREKISNTMKGRVPKNIVAGWFRGKHFSEEHKKSLSLHSATKSKKMSKETRRKMGMARTGEKHFNWRGGITPINEQIRKSKEYNLWRTAVFTRDNFICIWCGTMGGKLQADHIKPFSLFPELRFAIDNGRTLCIKCHKTTETYGVKKFKHVI